MDVTSTPTARVTPRKFAYYLTVFLVKEKKEKEKKAVLT